MFDGKDKKTLIKYLLLASVFFLLMFINWTLKSLKDPIFSAICGMEFQPIVKLLSFSLLIPSLLAYTFLCDRFRKETLFFLLSGFYFSLFLILSILLSHPEFGLYANSPPGALRVLGWPFYISVESFGSIMIMFFWAMTTSQSTSDEGKNYFPFIIFAGQFGSIAGPLLVSFVSKFEIQFVLLVAIIAIPIAPIVMKVVVHYFGKQSNDHNPDPESKQLGLLAGIRIVKDSPYALGILGITSLHEVVSTFIDFEMKFLASQTYHTPNAFAGFMSRYGITVNILTMTLSLLGTKALIKRMGIKICLVLYPIVVSVLVLIIFFHPSLWTLFTCLVIYKVANYGINNPSKEILYIPTDDDTRYKAKAWSDTIGPRSAKALGSLVTNSFKHSFTQLLNLGSVFSFLVIGFWIYIALRVGKQYDEKEEMQTVSE